MPNYSDEDKRKHLILYCRFYDGTDKDVYSEKLQAHEIDKSHLPPPECMKDEYTLPYAEVVRLKNASSLRYYEKWWTNRLFNGDVIDSCISDYIADGNKDFDANDGTPISLKAVIWNRYCQHCDWMVSKDQFYQWYRETYSCEPTNREKRAAQRRPDLIAKCGYYHGEPAAPWESADEDSLRRNRIWTIEKTWVDELSMSFSSPMAKHGLLKKLGLEGYFKDEGVSLSLINSILERCHQIAEDVPSELDPDGAKAFYKDVYLKLKP